MSNMTRKTVRARSPTDGTESRPQKRIDKTPSSEEGSSSDDAFERVDPDRVDHSISRRLAPAVSVPPRHGVVPRQLPGYVATTPPNEDYIPPKRRNSLSCTHCGRVGHAEDTCRMAHPELLRQHKHYLAQKRQAKKTLAEQIQVKPKWTLPPTAIPSAAKKVYCVLRGRTPGFYYDWSGDHGAEAQVKGFQDNLYQAFPKGAKGSIQKDGKISVAAEAEEYMNHDPSSCAYGCGQKCREAMQEEAAKAEETDFDVEQQTESNIKQSKRRAKNLNSCRECGKRSPVIQTRVCQECFDSDSMATALSAAASKYELSEEQYKVLRLAASGRNVFFTGAAGTGKSRVLEAVVSFMDKQRLTPRVVAPTGMAALHVYGTTIHMYAGWDVKLAVSSLEAIGRAASKKKNRTRFWDTDVLIIDEVSMVEGNMLGRLSYAMQQARQYGNPNPLPFGGVQVIITGDFYQLPPVLPFETCFECGEQLQGWEEKTENIYTCVKHGEFRDEDKYAFASPVWSACNFALVELLQVHRQADRAFTTLLHRMRKGVDWTLQQENELLNHDHDVVFDEAVKLTPLRRQAEEINDAHMAALKSASRWYTCVDDLTWKQRHAEFLDPAQPDGMSRAPLKALHHHRYQDNLELKEGMLVILTRNLKQKQGLVNGSTGKVVGFTEMCDNTMPREKKSSKDEPRHGEEVINHAQRKYAVEKIMHFRQRSETKLWPVVRFKNGLEVTIYADCSGTELGKDEPYSLLSRTQIPLLAGWALSIHKSQGMTLDNVVVSLDRCFAPGQAYVALSRARSLRSMMVQTLPARSMLIPDQTVHDFMERTFGSGHQNEMDWELDVQSDHDTEEDFGDLDDEVMQQGEGIQVKAKNGGIRTGAANISTVDDDNSDYGELDEEHVELLDL